MAVRERRELRAALRSATGSSPVRESQVPGFPEFIGELAVTKVQPSFSIDANAKARRRGIGQQ